MREKYQNVKLQKRLARHGKEYDFYKWTFDIPPSMIEEIGWEKLAGSEFTCKIQGKRLMIEKK